MSHVLYYISTPNLNLKKHTLDLKKKTSCFQHLVSFRWDEQERKVVRYSIFQFYFITVDLKMNFQIFEML